MCAASARDISPPGSPLRLSRSLLLGASLLVALIAVLLYVLPHLPLALFAPSTPSSDSSSAVHFLADLLFKIAAFQGELQWLATIVLASYASFAGVKRWREARFEDLVNVSVNLLEDAAPMGQATTPRRRSARLSQRVSANGTSLSPHAKILKFRTIAETLLANFVLDAQGRTILSAAAVRTTAGQPIVPLDFSDAMCIKILTINQLSALFATPWLRHAVGLPTKISTFVFAWCNEVDPRREVRMRTTKLRVMLVEKEALKSIMDMARNGQRAAPEFPQAALRWDTLVSIGAAYFGDVDLMGGFDLPEHWVATIDVALPLAS